MKKETKIIITAIAVMLLTVAPAMFVLWYQNKTYRNELVQADIAAAVFKNTITKDGKRIAEQEQHIISLEQAKKQTEYDLSQLKNKGIKDASTIIWLRSEITRLKLDASYVDTIIDTIVIRENTDLKVYRRVPSLFSYKDQWAVVSGTVQATNVELNSIITYSEPSIVLGWETGYFKKSKPIVVYEDKNPYSKVTNMNNMVIQKKPVFYKTPMWYRVEGAAILYGIAKGIQALK